MNIFVVNRDPVKAAKDLCDKHVVKMILETAQMLCSAHNGTAPYKPTHVKHPCTIWASVSMDNYEWLLSHGLALCEEYTRRYGKRHKTHDVLEWLDANRPPLSRNGLTPFAQAMPDEFKDPDPVEAYRKYYIGAKKTIAVWNHSSKPSWWPY
jgi:hypothetical protein